MPICTVGATSTISTTSTIISTADTIYSTWIGGGTTNSCTTNTIWTGFMASGGTNTSTVTQFYSQPQAFEPPPPPTPQQKWARYLIWERPKRKALALLLRLLREDQLAEFCEHKHFHVVGGHTGTRYRIRKGRIGNVDVYNNGVIIHRLCAHPNIGCPDIDVMIAQKLHLESPEDELPFVQKANVHPLPRFGATETRTLAA